MSDALEVTFVQISNFVDDGSKNICRKTVSGSIVDTQTNPTG